MKSITFGLAVVLCAASIAGQVHAATIDYIFSGTFTGSLGSTNYTDQAFTVDLTGDTNNVTFAGEYFSQANSTNFTIGSTTGTFLDTNTVVLNPDFLGGTVVFGQAPEGVAEGLSNSALGTYNLGGPFALVSGSVSQTPGSTYSTSQGNLVFSDISALSFEAVEPSAVPLPAGFPLFAAALGLVGLLGWNRQRKAVRI